MVLRNPLEATPPLMTRVSIRCSLGVVVFRVCRAITTLLARCSKATRIASLPNSLRSSISISPSLLAMIRLQELSSPLKLNSMLLLFDPDLVSASGTPRPQPQRVNLRSSSSARRRGAV